MVRAIPLTIGVNGEFTLVSYADSGSKQELRIRHANESATTVLYIGDSSQLVQCEQESPNGSSPCNLADWAPRYPQLLMDIQSHVVPAVLAQSVEILKTPSTTIKVKRNIDDTQLAYPWTQTIELVAKSSNQKDAALVLVQDAAQLAQPENGLQCPTQILYASSSNSALSVLIDIPLPESAWQSLVTYWSLDQIWSAYYAYWRASNGSDSARPMELNVPPVLLAAAAGTDGGAQTRDLWYQQLTEERAHTADPPLPFFRAIDIPTGLSETVRQWIDPDGDGVIGNIHEAWRTYCLLTRQLPADAGSKIHMSADDPAILDSLRHAMTVVDRSKAEIQVLGHRFKIDPLTMYGNDQRYFVIGEAIRSFGPAMVARWARGEFRESSLQLVAESPSEWFERSLAQEPWFARPFIRWTYDYYLKARAVYFKTENSIFFGDMFGDFNQIDQGYFTIRHELGHSVDDFLLPQNPGSSLGSMREGLVSHEYSAFARMSFPNWRSVPILSGSKRRQLLERIKQTSVPGSFPFNLTDHKLRNDSEFFASLFEMNDSWRYTSPALRGALTCYLDGGSAEHCLQTHAPIHK